MAARKVAEAQTADPDADKSFHFVADFVKHPPNLAIDSLAQGHAQSCRLDGKNFFETSALTVERDAVKQFWRERGVPRPVERDLVFLLDLVTRVGETLRQLAVVREEKKAFGLGVEPANVEEPRQMRRQQIKDGVPRMRIASGRNKSSRLVEHDVEPALTVDKFAVDFDMVAFARLGTEVGADLAVDRDAASGDQFVAMPPRTQTGRGKETIEAHGEVERLSG